MKYPELSKQEVNSFVEENVQKLISNIILKEDDTIFVNRELMKNGKGVFVHPIYICPVEQLCRTEYDNSELFKNKGNNLFLYLKGRMLIQSTTTWEIYSENPLLIKQYKITCNYSIKEN